MSREVHTDNISTIYRQIRYLRYRTENADRNPDGTWAVLSADVWAKPGTEPRFFIFNPIFLVLFLIQLMKIRFHVLFHRYQKPLIFRLDHFNHSKMKLLNSISNLTSSFHVNEWIYSLPYLHADRRTFL